MKKTFSILITAAVSAALLVPAVATAGGPAAKGKGNGASAKVATQESAPVADKATRKTARKQAKGAVKVERKQAKAAAKIIKAPVVSESSDESPSIESSPSADATRAVGHGVANALARITRNIERKIAKFGAGAKLPLGLMNTWFKFSTWLGNDTTMNPWTPPVSTDSSPTPPPSTDTSPTPDSVEESPSVDPSLTVAPVLP